MRSTLSISKQRKEYQALKFGPGQGEGFGKEAAFDLASRIYQSIPKRFEDEYGQTIYKEIPEDDEYRIVRLISNMISAGEEVEPYAQIKSYIRQQYRGSWAGTKRDIFKYFKTHLQTRPIYNKFNSYMYRNGYSAVRYWLDNVKVEKVKDVIYCHCELPSLGKLRALSNRSRRWKEKVRYESLEIEYNYSSDQIVAYFTQ